MKRETNTTTIIASEPGLIAVIMFNPRNICRMKLKPNTQKQYLTIFQTHRNNSVFLQFNLLQTGEGG